MTAVEWLKNQVLQDNRIDDLISGYYSKEQFKFALIRKFEQALEMEKEQIIEAHGLIAKLQEDGSHKLISGETYYNETYKPSA
jgi:hypothetical protein